MKLHPFAVALVTCMLTSLSAFQVFNFMPSEKKIECQLQRLYGAGVKVHLMLDCIGSMASNKRTHRKLLVVDGKIGFAGGLRINTHGKDIDSGIVRAASRERWGELLVGDALAVSVGATNFDKRAFMVAALADRRPAVTICMKFHQ